MQAQTKATGLLSGAADVIESLDSLLPKLSTAPATPVAPAPEATVEELRQLARIISDTASLPWRPGRKQGHQGDRPLPLPCQRIIRDVRRTYAELQQLRKRSGLHPSPTATTIEDLADLFGASEATRRRRRSGRAPSRCG